MRIARLSLHEPSVPQLPEQAHTLFSLIFASMCINFRGFHDVEENAKIEPYGSVNFAKLSTREN